ncbi:unnamed protein product [Paramecium pentaurelia]|uniref:Transmembrane protein n=1 Tax=Paramecium pentaurelia TaxID=43138 RepID=A0A8S1RX75_9CILI|nr:unnamed protein product [Paramecium pentaurelia]
MQQQNNQVEKQQINWEISSNPQMKQFDSKDLINKYFTSKRKWITFSLTFFVLCGIGIFLGTYFSQNVTYAPRLKKFQRDEFQQVDEICLYHTSNKIQNCTQIKQKDLLMLKKLKVTTVQQKPGGTREYNEMVNENTEIEQQIKKFLRILQEIQSTVNSNLCQGIPQDECGDVNEVPLVTIITDQQTGAVQQNWFTLWSVRSYLVTFSFQYYSYCSQCGRFKSRC